MNKNMRAGYSIAYFKIPSELGHGVFIEKKSKRPGPWRTNGSRKNRVVEKRDWLAEFFCITKRQALLEKGGKADRTVRIKEEA